MAVLYERIEGMQVSSRMPSLWFFWDDISTIWINMFYIFNTS